MKRIRKTKRLRYRKLSNPVTLAEYRTFTPHNITPDGIIAVLKKRGLARDLAEWLGPRLRLFAETHEQHSRFN